MTRTAIAIVAALVLGATGGSALLLTRAGPDRTGPAPRATVQERAYTPRITATGSVRLIAGSRVQVGSQVSGVVRHLAVTDGSRVAPGDLIAELDDREAQGRLADAAARVSLALADSAQAAIDLERVTALARADGATPQELLAAQTQRARADAALVSARAAEGLARVGLDHTRIRAPIGGLVASVTVHEGETVASSFAAPTFVTIVDPARIECVALVDETDIGRVAVGESAEFTVDAYPGRTFAGRVVQVAPDATIISGVVDYEVTVRIAGDRVGLKPQMTANVSIAAESRRALVVPSAAVRQGANGPYVWLVQNAQPVERAIVTGARQLDVTEIKSGLRPGDTVLTGGFPDEAAPRSPGA